MLTGGGRKGGAVCFQDPHFPAAEYCGIIHLFKVHFPYYVNSTDT